MLIDFQKLLVTTKAKKCKVHFSLNQSSLDKSSTISLHGLVNDGWLGGKFCCSGNLLNEVLTTLDLLSTSSNEEIVDKAKNLCSEHQNELLTAELKQQKGLEQLFEEEKNKVGILTEQVNELTQQLEQALTKISTLEKVEQSNCSGSQALKFFRPYPGFPLRLYPHCSNLSQSVKRSSSDSSIESLTT